MYRAKDYAAAGLPVLPVVRGMRHTKIRMLIYTFAFGLAACALTIFSYASSTYLVIAVIISSIWLWRGIKGFNTLNDVKWARKMFSFSLIVLLSFSLGIAFTHWLP